MAFIGIFDALIGVIGEAFVYVFNLFTDLLVDLCTMEESFTATYSKTLFGEKGLFLNPGSSVSVFPSETVDPTKILQAAGFSLLFGLMIIQLLKSMFGEYSKAESPQIILVKGLAYTVAISFYHIWTNGILKIIISPIFKSFAKTESGTVASATGATISNCFQSLSDNILGWDGDTLLDKVGFAAQSVVFETGGLFKTIFFLIVCIPLGIKFISFSFEICERYIQIFFITLFGPLCLACGVNPNLETVSKRWFSTWLNAMILICIDMFFIKLSIVATVNFISSLAVDIGSLSILKDCIVPYIAVYSLMKIAGDADDIANALGLSSIGAMGAGLTMAAGLRTSAGTVKNIALGNGSKASKNGGKFFGGENMKKAGQAGSKAAAFARAVGGRGVIGAAAATIVLSGSKTVRGAMAMDALEKLKGRNAFFDKMDTDGTKFSENLALAAKLGKTGAFNGDESRKQLSQIINNAGIEGKVSRAAMKNGHLVMRTSDGKEIAMRRAESDADMFGTTFTDESIDNAKNFETEINGERWVGAYAEPKK